MIRVTKVDTFAGHRDAVYTIVPGPVPGSFFSAGADGMVVQWDLNKPDVGKLVARVESSIYAMAFQPSEGELWIGQNYEGIQFVKPEERRTSGSVKVTSSAIFDMLLVGEEAFLAFGDGVIGVLDIPNRAIKRHVKLSEKSARALSLSPGGGHLAIGLSDASVRILDRESMRPLQSLVGHTNSVFTAVYSPDGRFLITAGRDAQFRVWDVQHDYRLVSNVAAHMYAINHLAFSPDGRLFATCSMDKSIKLWDALSFKLLKVIDRSRHAGHGTSVNKLLWSSDPTCLISASDDRMISVWDISL